MSADLLPALTAADPDEAIARTGLMISAYAAGVVVGAPAIADVRGSTAQARPPHRARHRVHPRHRRVGARPDLRDLVSRHGSSRRSRTAAYFGIAALVAASLMGPGSRGPRCVARAGGPHDRQRRRRSAHHTARAVRRLARRLSRGRSGLRAERRRHRNRGARPTGRPWSAPFGASSPDSHGFRSGSPSATGAIGFGGLFAVYSYIAKLTTGVAGLPEVWCPWALVSAGLGMTVGNLLGGRLADRGPLRATFSPSGFFVAALVLLALISWHPVGLFAGLFLAVGAGRRWAPPSRPVSWMSRASPRHTRRRREPLWPEHREQPRRRARRRGHRRRLGLRRAGVGGCRALRARRAARACSAGRSTRRAGRRDHPCTAEVRLAEAAAAARRLAQVDRVLRRDDRTQRLEEQRVLRGA